jgi:Glycosyltransferase sugar-binding region containing DXD motif
MIPNRYHFVWFGREFPLTHALAIRSVAATCAPESIVLHATDELTGQPDYDALVTDLPAFTRRQIDPTALVREANLSDPRRLSQVWAQLAEQKRWASLSDIVRYLVLYRDGGVYLDLDTITLRDLRPLLNTPGFCGRERILVDGAVHRRASPWRRFRTGPLDLARWICSRTEGGVRHFSRIAKLYLAAINNAVLALPPRHPLAREALERVPDLAPQIPRRRGAIGPDLLQDLIDGAGRSDVTVFAPAYFYPLGPQMAAQLFRVRRSADRVDRALADSLGAETHVLHWYNDNLKALPRPPDRETIRALAERQMFARLALPFLPASACSRAAR